MRLNNTCPQTRKVYDALRALGWEGIKAEDLSMRQVAERLTSDLGFVVTEAHLEYTYRMMEWERWPSR